MPIISGSEKALQWLNMSHVVLVARRSALAAGKSLNDRQIQDVDRINDALEHIQEAKRLLQHDHGIANEFQFELPF